ncbi:MAG: GreA/GreB family elongation factor [Candidatus Moeniiplasma glomeromycotorum]|nr:GreA/GreB family elongation factor [Candidatus Moeniiplasma glomeromycotorum]MCE8167054.1 GreA/GreB family elongation factor [Candidatus Moeniiplasma glomeromycotorum]MCE8168934.1 GreA/GreB family elongation factor [Candidatus Moeniiplasma glomeromycotorum]
MEKNKENRGYNFSLLNLQQLEQKRSLLIEELRLAALNGDLAENFDWTSLGEEIRKLERKISLLKQKIATTKHVLSPSKIVVYQSLSTKQNKTVQLTDFLVVKTPFPPFQQVSFASPLGLTLANKKVGEIGEVKTKKGSYWIKVLNIEEN